MNMREAILAQYDNLSDNPNVMKQAQAERYGLAYVNEKLVRAVSTATCIGYISSEIVLVKDVELRPETASSGKVVALCEPLATQHRRLKKWEMQ
jgi:hypothetical protein